MSDHLVLALDTATPATTVAVAVVTGSGLRGLAERRTVDPRAHGELLAPQIRATLDEAGIRPAGLTAIVAGLGPGPFTGLRVGLATAAAMGQALGIPTYGVCSLDGLGLAAGPGRVLVATDARRREVYYATYLDGKRVTDPQVAKPADIAADADRAVGEGALKYSDVFGLPIDQILLYPPGTALIALAADRIRAGDKPAAVGAERVAVVADPVAVGAEPGSAGAAPASGGAEPAASGVRGRSAGERLIPLYLRRPDAVESARRKQVLQ